MDTRFKTITLIVNVAKNYRALFIDNAQACLFLVGWFNNMNAFIAGSASSNVFFWWHTQRHLKLFLQEIIKKVAAIGGGEFWVPGIGLLLHSFLR